MRAPLRSAGWALGLLGLTACQDPTQVRVRVSTEDLVCGPGDQRVNSTALASAPASDQPPTQVVVTDQCETKGDDATIGDLVYVPSGEASSSFSLGVYLGLGDKSGAACQRACGVDCIEARRRISFVPQQSLLMPIVFEPSCIGRCCPDGETCVGGQCVSEVIDPCEDGTGPGCDDPSPRPHQLVAAAPAGDGGLWLVGDRATAPSSSTEGFVQLRGADGIESSTVTCESASGDVHLRAATVRDGELLVVGEAEGTIACGAVADEARVTADLPERASFLIEVGADGRVTSAPIVLAHHNPNDGSQLQATDVIARANIGTVVLFRMAEPVTVDTASPIRLTETGGLVVEVIDGAVRGHLPIDAKGGIDSLQGTVREGALILTGTSPGSLTAGDATLPSTTPIAFVLSPSTVSPNAVVAHHQIGNGGGDLRVRELTLATDFGVVMALTHEAGSLSGVDPPSVSETDSCSLLVVTPTQTGFSVLRGHEEPRCNDIVAPPGEVPESSLAPATALGLVDGTWKLGWPEPQGVGAGASLATRPLAAFPGSDGTLVVAGALGPNEQLGLEGASLCTGDESGIFVLPGNPTPFVACLAPP